MRKLSSSLSCALVVSLIAGVGAVHADPGKPKRGRAHQVVPTGAEDAPGAPSDAQAEAELEAMTSRSSIGLVEVVRVDGTSVVDLEGRFMDVAIAGPHGVDCHAGTSAVTVVKARAKAKAKAKRKTRRGPAPVVVAPSMAPALEVM